MNDIPCWSITDLAARYALEPTLRDIFVEGQFDQEVITRALRDKGHTDRIVYEIDSVDVPDPLVSQHGFTTGNKQRVIVLARELAELPRECAFRCLVDRDLDHWFGPLESTARLVWTDYCALELYFCCDAILHDILITTARCRIANWHAFCKSMTEALRTFYLLRLADRELDLKLEWLSPNKCLAIQSGLVVFNRAEYVKRLLLHNGHGNQSSDYEASVDRWNMDVAGDHRLCIHGHDFVEMLAWAIKKNKGLKEFASVKAINRILVLIAARGSAIIERLD